MPFARVCVSEPAACFTKRVCIPSFPTRCSTQIVVVRPPVRHSTRKPHNGSVRYMHNLKAEGCGPKLTTVRNMKVCNEYHFSTFHPVGDKYRVTRCLLVVDAISLLRLPCDWVSKHNLYCLKL